MFKPSRSKTTVFVWAGAALLSGGLATVLPNEIGWAPTLMVIAIIGSFALLAQAANGAIGGTD